MNRKKVWILALAGTLFAAAIVYLILPVQPYKRAERLVDAIVNGDGAAMYHFSLDRERQQLGLTPAKFQQVWDQLVAPRIRQFSRASGQESYNEANGSEGVCHRFLQDSSGRKIDISATAFVTDSGDVQQLMMTHILQTAWFADYITKRGLPTTRTTMISAVLAGVRADKERLIAIGVPGLLDGDEDDSVPISWDAIERRCVAYLNTHSDSN